MDTVQIAAAEQGRSTQLSSNALIVQIAHVVDSLGWTSDTARLRKVAGYPQLGDAVPVGFQGRSFFRLTSPLETVRSWNGNLDMEVEHMTDTTALLDAQIEAERMIDTTALLAVQQAWAYFYRHSSGTKNVPDGVIETWEFPSDSAALKAMTAFAKVWPIPYFNTMPQYFVSGNILVIGNARAMAYSYDQRKVFNVLRARFRPVDFFPKNR